MNPRLIHPVPVVYRNVNTGATGWDDTLGEPTGPIVYEAAVTVDGQVLIYSTKRAEASVTGFELRGDGYALMYKEDADLVEINAKITSIENDACEWYVIEKQNRVHYGKPRMVRVYFVSKEKGSV